MLETFMNWLNADWLTEDKIPVRKQAKEFLDSFIDTYADAFDSISDGIESAIDGMLWALQAPPPLAVVAAFVALTWALQRRIVTCVFVLLGFMFILNQDYWEETTETLTLVVAACTTCMVIGVPLGVLMARIPWLYRITRPVLDMMQTLPTFVYLIPAIVFFGVGMVPGLLATVIFVLPAPIRLTRLGVVSTPPDLVEAVAAFGATSWQRLIKVELPYALPQIMAGLNQTIMLSLSMVVIAALVGADGLGVPVVRALNSVNPSLGLESGLIIVLVAVILDRMFKLRGDKS